MHNKHLSNNHLWEIGAWDVTWTGLLAANKRLIRFTLILVQSPQLRWLHFCHIDQWHKLVYANQVTTKRRTFVSDDDEVKGTRFTLLPKRTRNIDKRCKATVSRHWTLGSAELTSLREKTKTNEVSSMIALAFCLGAILDHKFRTWQNIAVSLSWGDKDWSSWTLRQLEVATQTSKIEEGIPKKKKISNNLHRALNLC